jgi:hypothetical protein
LLLRSGGWVFIPRDKKVVQCLCARFHFTLTGGELGYFTGSFLAATGVGEELELELLGGCWEAGRLTR